jgi:hypothetical protein
MGRMVLAFVGLLLIASFAEADSATQLRAQALRTCINEKQITASDKKNLIHKCWTRDVSNVYGQSNVPGEFRFLIALAGIANKFMPTEVNEVLDQTDWITIEQGIDFLAKYNLGSFDLDGKAGLALTACYPSTIPGKLAEAASGVNSCYTKARNIITESYSTSDVKKLMARESTPQLGLILTAREFLVALQSEKEKELAFKRIEKVLEKSTTGSKTSSGTNKPQ